MVVHLVSMMYLVSSFITVERYMYTLSPVLNLGTSPDACRYITFDVSLISSSDVNL